MSAEIWRAVQNQQAQRSSLHDNTTRMARVSMVYKTVGTGDSLTDVMDFGVAFLQLPDVFTGVVVTSPVPQLGLMARLSSGVHAWVRNASGHYTGASLWMVVDGIDSIAYHVEHHFSFSQLAEKALPSSLIETAAAGQEPYKPTIS